MPDFDLSNLSASEFWRLAVALAVGLIVGAEREQHKAEANDPGAAGIRTFTVAAMLGGVSILIHPALVCVLAGAIAVAAIAGYALGDRRDPGLTTELSLLLTFALGALANSRPAVALAGALCAAAILAARTRMHEFIRKTLSPGELRDALVLGVAALVLLPLIPDRPVGPYGVINLHTVWRLAVVMMALTAAGYVAQRALGSKVGLLLAGLAGGFVSSIATIGAMGARAKQSPQLRSSVVAGACASTVATFVMLAAMIGLADPHLLSRLLWPLLLGGATAAVYAALWERRALEGPGEVMQQGSAFNLTSVLFFAGLVSVVGVVSAFAAARFGSGAVEVTTALAGFADTHASSASAASLFAEGKIPESVALIAILLAFTTNALTKVVTSFFSGPRDFALRVSAGQALVVAATWAGFAVLQRLAS